jgi:hypothetical protein
LFRGIDEPIDYRVKHEGTEVDKGNRMAPIPQQRTRQFFFRTTAGGNVKYPVIVCDMASGPGGGKRLTNSGASNTHDGCNEIIRIQ